MDFEVLFALTIYRDGRVRLTTANGKRATPLVAATLREVAAELESGRMVLSEEDAACPSVSHG